MRPVKASKRTEYYGSLIKIQQGKDKPFIQRSPGDILTGAVLMLPHVSLTFTDTNKNTQQNPQRKLSSHFGFDVNFVSLGVHDDMKVPRGADFLCVFSRSLYCLYGC